MTTQQFSKADWDALYTWLHGNVELLENQTDRLSQDITSLSGTITDNQKLLVQMVIAAKAVSEETKRAQSAWSNADQWIAKLAQSSHAAAFAGSQQAINQAITGLNNATGRIVQAEGRMNDAVQASRSWTIGLSILLLVLCLASAVGGWYLARQAIEPLTMQQTSLMSRGKMFDEMYAIASKEQRRLLVTLAEKVRQKTASARP